MNEFTKGLLLIGGSILFLVIVLPIFKGSDNTTSTLGEESTFESDSTSSYIPVSTPIPSPKEPSAEAKILAASIINAASESQRNQIITNMTGGNGSLVDATREIAFRLDANPELYALALNSLIQKNSSNNNSVTTLEDIELQLWQLNNTLEDIQQNR